MTMKILWIGAALALLGCEEETIIPPAGGPAGAAATAGGPAAAAAGDGAAAVPSNLPPLPVKEFKERDFSETASSRNPFRSYEDLFVEDGTNRHGPQRAVLANEFALEELKLTGIISRGSGRVLLTDPKGVGWIAKNGDFIARSEAVSAGGTSRVEVQMNWRVDRIRENDVVFVREDPAHPEIPAVTRVLTLRTADELEYDLAPVELAPAGYDEKKGT
jgi:type IV pilus assembly protein PilP